MEEIVRHYYSLGKYTTDDMTVFVQANYISVDVFKELTGKDYVAAD